MMVGVWNLLLRVFLFCESLLLSPITHIAHKRIKHQVYYIMVSKHDMTYHGVIGLGYDNNGNREVHIPALARCHFAVFLGKTLYSHSASLHPGTVTFCYGFYQLTKTFLSLKESILMLIRVIFFSWQVDMPVFFYIDPEFTEDPAMAKVDTITLSYTFFEAKEGERLGL